MAAAEHEIVAQVYAAKKASDAADALIRQYMGFIRSEAMKTVKKTHGENDDEISVAMFAFYEAVMNYERGRGAFLPFAARAIRNRLIDHYRREKKHEHVGSLHAPMDEEERTELLDTLPDQKNEVEAYELREASRREIREFEKKLQTFGLSFSDVADNCPRQERTLEACRRVLDCARKNPELLDRFEQTGRLPVNELSQKSGTDKKTMERHRKYLAAILLAFTNGYEIIRGHLCQIGPGKGGSGQ